ncbi:DUF6429 family protein [Agrobacterium larrymoorei]|uniref:DUF6429 domain-containing protein n=1 Tax=Agrobacterium larrymoorei TaxID=160699 RepID=A0A4D7DZW1_9HYPH|nr:DUF6429 family protein [Agrobacterium larrymoorei]QCI97480.1 hypothetical protein CFBP5473_05835 [Agrobacterium larrymoorei]QYA07081.1 hypothetical protein J5285_13845 [Agrobacterium larrymoorei]
MDTDNDKIDDTVLALLQLTLHENNRAWKGMDWDVLARLHERGFIYDPVNKNKSVVLTKEGAERSQALFLELFAKKPV